ncbi:MAG: DNA repair protein RecN [bacterium]
MLIKLIVRNYALIEELQIKYQPGLNIVTGETGAGKSILLGALSLILGQRADTSVLNNEHDKCIVEGLFNIEGLDLKDFFLVNDLDYDKQTLIRREISPAGKSRAFINDTPVNLILLKELGEKLIDIHSQHENLNLGSHAFQLKVIDNFTGNSQLLKEYQLAYHDFKNVEHEFESLKSEAEKNKQDLDYYSFQLNELEEARLMEDEDIDLQQEQEILSNAGDIKLNLANASQFLYNDDDGGVHRLKEALDHLGKAKNHFKDCEELASRLESAYIEVKDIAREVDVLAEKVEVDPARLDFVNQRLDLLFTLQQKHGVVNSNELIKKRDELDNMVNNIANSGLRLEELEKKMSETKQIASKLALQLHNARENAVPDLVETIQAMLQHLGMPNARFHVGITELGEMNENGLDRVDFLFSANFLVMLWA